MSYITPKTIPANSRARLCFHFYFWVFGFAVEEKIVPCAYCVVDSNRCCFPCHLYPKLFSALKEQTRHLAEDKNFAARAAAVGRVRRGGTSVRGGISSEGRFDFGPYLVDVGGGG